jgi:hypothetical protein
VALSALAKSDQGERRFRRYRKMLLTIANRSEKLHKLWPDCVNAASHRADDKHTTQNQGFTVHVHTRSTPTLMPL